MRFVVSGIVSICVFMLIQFAAVSVIRHRANSEIWYEEPYSKSSLLLSNDRADFVFVGSSKTQNHVDTDLLSAYGLWSLNLGVPGVRWESFPYLIEVAALRASVGIVVSIEEEDLFRRPAVAGLGLTLGEIMAGYEYGQLFGALACLSPAEFAKALPSNRFLPYLRVASRKSTKRAYEMLDAVMLDGALPSFCQINYIRSRPGRWVVTLKSGNAFIVSNRKVKISNERSDCAKREFSEDSLRYLVQICERIHGNDLLPVVVINRESSMVIGTLNVERLKALLPDYVLLMDHSAYIPLDDDWADHMHLNVNGRRRYSEYMYESFMSSGLVKRRASL